ncbi:hypothetical protein GY15_14885 [Delftia sp. 670]|nr:hypothetical protein GY15_14885 [Delftia sp. 670]
MGHAWPAWIGRTAKNKRAARLPVLPFWPEKQDLLLAETVAEALHTAAHVVHRLLRAGVEGVRLGRGVQLEQGVVLAFEVSVSFVFTQERVTNLKPLDRSTNSTSR